MGTAGNDRSSEKARRVCSLENIGKCREIRRTLRYRALFLSLQYDERALFDFSFFLGLSSAALNSPDHRVSSVTNNQSVMVRQNEPVRRFACPIGFFRLKRFCYYLSAGTAVWREAHFHCKDRNATLAILDRNGKERMLRKYLMGDQFSEYTTTFAFVVISTSRDFVSFTTTLL